MLVLKLYPQSYSYKLIEITNAFLKKSTNLSQYANFVLRILNADFVVKTIFGSIIRAVFLLSQLWIINYYVKSSSNNLSNENINTGVSVVFKTKRELKCQNELFLKYHFSGNTSLTLPRSGSEWPFDQA